MASSTIHQQDTYLLLTDGTRLPVVGNVEVRSNTEIVRVMNAWKPDEKWEHTDSNGHVHRYLRDEEDVPRLPTLERHSVLVECDGMCGDEGCDGYHVDEWNCRECDEKVEPRFVHDYAVEQGGIPVSVTSEYAFTVEGDIPFGVLIEDAKFAVQSEQGERLMEVPPLSVISRNGTSTPDGMVITSQLSGFGWKAVKRKPVGP